MSDKGRWLLFLLTLLAAAASQWLLYKAGNPNAVWLYDMISWWVK